MAPFSVVHASRLPCTAFTVSCESKRPQSDASRTLLGMDFYVERDNGYVGVNS